MNSPSPHLSPVLIICGPKGGVSPFNLVHLTVAESAERLTRLAATPFHMLRFFGRDHTEKGVTYPLDLWFVTGKEGIGPQPRLQLRPAVIWGEDLDAVDIAAHVLESGAVFALLISSDEAVMQAARHRRLPNERFRIVNVSGGPEARFCPDTSTRIWSAFLDMICELTRLAGGDPSRPSGPMAPEMRTPVSLQRQLEAIRLHSFCPWSEGWDGVEVPWDFVAAPNAVLLNFARYKIPLWQSSALEPNVAHASALANAKLILATRGLTNLVLMITDALAPDADSKSTDLLKNLQSVVPPAVFELVAAAAAPGVAGDAFARQLRSLFERPPLELMRLSPHQFILLCPSATAAMPGAVDRLLSDEARLADPSDATRREPEYFKAVMKAAGEGGRIVSMPEPTNQAQKLIAAQMAHTVRMETMHLSALSMLYSTRFTVPILKIDRCGVDVFEPFQAVHAAFDTGEQLEAGTTADQLDKLSRHATNLFPPGVLDLITEHEDALVHGFSDFPLEFVHAGGDYLGYNTQLSRIPITPGFAALANYTATELTTPLPTRAEQFLLVSPFGENDKLIELVRSEAEAAGLPLTIQRVARASELVQKINDEDVGCLVYLGHGYFDSAEDEGALVLRDDFFRAEDLRRVQRVPPVVVLVGCSTAPAVSASGGMHLAFLQAGTPLVIGTSFPVPKVIGADFVIRFVRHLLQRDVYPWRDLVEIVTAVRRGMRPSSEMLSLLRQKRIDLPTLERVRDNYNNQVQAFSPLSAFAHYARSHRALAAVLTAEGVLPSAEISPLDWGTVPYPLFFSVLGFPWTRRSESWAK
jgi:hypothetical protein